MIDIEKDIGIKSPHFNLKDKINKEAEIIDVQK